jgi:hypothetical protein
VDFVALIGPDWVLRVEEMKRVVRGVVSLKLEVAAVRVVGARRVRKDILSSMWLWWWLSKVDLPESF